jgi:hypothetical protein
LFDAVAAHHGLDGLGQDFPVGVQIRGEAGGVGFQLGDAALGGL